MSGATLAWAKNRPFVTARISVRSGTGTRTGFSAQLTQSQELEPERPPQSVCVRQEKDPSPEDCRKSILLLSSDDVLRSMLRAYLESLNYLVFSCTDAQRAAQVFHSSAAIDLLIADLHLLGSSSLRLASELSAEHGDLPVLFITSPNSDGTVLSAIRRRGWTVLSKPILLPQLFALIQEVLGKQPQPQRDSRVLHPTRAGLFPAGEAQTIKFAPRSARDLEKRDEGAQGGRR